MNLRIDRLVLGYEHLYMHYHLRQENHVILARRVLDSKSCFVFD